jgi:hypothetical protein
MKYHQPPGEELPGRALPQALEVQKCRMSWYGHSPCCADSGALDRAGRVG